MVWNYEQIVDKNVPQKCINGKWVPVRPINYQYRSIKEKLKECFLVWTGKAEVFMWPEGQ